ncbi:MAG: type II toxin-antitoxin system YafQ family toxin [Lactobacillales bacterium]|jgi:mRNA interferase YafQ|nr:type II toxin-antitoxin system YafQ family toxin [Lactobacillales bacterium]
MNLKISASTKFKKDIKKLSATRLAKVGEIVNLLASGKELPEANRDHQLKGRYGEFRECHVEPDLLLIYQIVGNELELYLVRTGSHSQLF